MEVTTQLVAAQQRVVKLTPLAKEVANLRSWVDEARRDADEAEKAFEALSVRSRKDEEEAARVRKERDELLQTTERLRLECRVAHEERDQAFQEHDQSCREHDDAQQKVSSL